MKKGFIFLIFLCTLCSLSSCKENPEDLDYVITLKTVGKGSVTGDGIYSYGTQAVLTATPERGYKLDRWSDGALEKKRTLRVTQNISLTAYFIEGIDNPCTLHIDNSEGGSVKGGGTYEKGDSIILEAIPNDGYMFKSWSDGITDNPRIIILQDNMSLGATFVKKGIIMLNVVGDGTVSGAGDYEIGTVVTISAIPNEGAMFSNWADISSYNDDFLSSTRQIIVKQGIQEFTAYMPTIPEGAIHSVFFIGKNKTTFFSKGNLQYQVTTNTWKFADNQYDAIGENNTNISDSYNGWIDLFGWGTSGWNSGVEYYQPYSSAIGDGYLDSYLTLSLTGDYKNADWGIYNPILNGGNEANMWRTLTYDELVYLMHKRPNAHSKYFKANVAGINGLVLIPDNNSSNQYIYVNADKNANDYTTNVYTKEQWDEFEKDGLVFLPAAGHRSGTEVKYSNNSGAYWVANFYAAGTDGYDHNGIWVTYPKYLYILYFTSLDLQYGVGTWAQYVTTTSVGLSVRLVSK